MRSWELPITPALEGSPRALFPQEALVALRAARPKGRSCTGRGRTPTGGHPAEPFRDRLHFRAARGREGRLDRLNYHHLLYFRTMAKAGGMAAAARELGLTESAVSMQLKAFERSIGQRLLARNGRRLALTDLGRIAFHFADDLFRIGEELQAVLRDGLGKRNVRFEVGLVDNFPPLVAHRLLEPALSAVPGLRLMARRGSLRSLLASLAEHDLDVVLADEPGAERLRARTHDHLLGECGLTFYAGKRHARLAKGFPGSLHGAPMLLPSEASPLRAPLESWLRGQAIRPTVAGEFADQALLRAFAARGLGFFAGSSVIENEIRRVAPVSVIGRTEEVRVRFYAITAERRISHPAVVAISKAARKRLFG